MLKMVTLNKSKQVKDMFLFKDLPLQFETEFMCEIEKWKSKWIIGAFNPKLLFEDMRCLGSGLGKDIITSEVRPVPKAGA